MTLFAATAQVARADSAHAFNVAYTGDVWHNTRGGLQTRTGFVDNLNVQLTINGEAAWGIEGVLVHWRHEKAGHSAALISISS